MINKEDCCSCHYSFTDSNCSVCKGYKPATINEVINKFGKCLKSNCDKKQCSICIKE